MVKKDSAYQGCLLGLAAGDALGYTVDSKSLADIRAYYGQKGLMGYDLRGDFADVTSYTQVAAFVANGLLLALTRQQRSAYLRCAALALREWALCQNLRREPEDTRCWISRVSSLRHRCCMDTRMPDALSRETLGTTAAPVNASNHPGSLTAAVAVGLFFDESRMEPQQIGQLGAGVVALTHGSPEAFLSGAALAYSVAGILQEPERPFKEQFLQAASAMRSQFQRQFPMAEAVAARMEKAVALAGASQLPTAEVMERLACGTASECLAGAIYASLVSADDFDAAMILAVNHSGHSAAVGALTGALLGARLGAEALPGFYVDALEHPAVLRQLGTDLAQDRMAIRIFDDDWDQKYVQGRPVEIN